NRETDAVPLDAPVAQRDLPAATLELALEALEALIQLEPERPAGCAGERAAPGAVDLRRNDPQVQVGGPGSLYVVLLCRLDFHGLVGLPVSEIEIVRHDA